MADANSQPPAVQVERAGLVAEAVVAVLLVADHGVTQAGAAEPHGVGGATTGVDSTLTKWIETSPLAMHCSAQWPMRPR